MTYSHNSRRLATDAKIVLKRAGYVVTHARYSNGVKSLLAHPPEWPEGHIAGRLFVNGGTVDNDEVIKLCAARGCDGSGYKRASA